MTSQGETKEKKIPLKSLTQQELEALMADFGQPAYRGRQLFGWLHKSTALTFSEMTNLPAALRTRMEEEATPEVLKTRRVQASAVDGTRKYLFSCDDDSPVESVLMRYRYGLSACISSQSGCAMGCRFCATGQGGLLRSLTAGEMADQVYRMAADAKERISHVVVMGMGEPLDNFDALARFVQLITDPDGVNLSQRNLTVSTCGIAPAIRRLADTQIREGSPQFTLALSLHAATQEKRMALMPAAKAWPLDEVMAACRYWQEKTGRRMTYEYALCAGENDGDEDARALAALLASSGGHVNLIPVNPVSGLGFASPDRNRTAAFLKKLENLGIHATIRREMGRDIDGACGQLKGRTLTEEQLLLGAP